MALVTTDILTLAEFSERRKLGRTSIFQRIRDGHYVDGLDYISDGSEKKFFWPCREMVMRDQLLMQMGMTVAHANTEPNSANELMVETALAIQPPMKSTEDLIKPKDNRRRALPQIANSRPGGRKPAFQVKRSAIQAA
ncbi:hypothetical protein FY034_13150 [Trichlorobacter lovleyi]|uniref:hypothetical protein n=1 Tax=Trichlorobacter lovleyi TaxID=313985 RepID=UPI0022404DA2|nr:hypothetical protein [Trichlorobacter lovleyi]QOX79838.1 hypothetical protein FY034_13150 [Trichlorobacter lovleyi]